MSGTAMAPPPTPSSRMASGSRGSEKSTAEKSSGEKASRRRYRESPTRRRCAAHPRSPPTTSPGSRMKTNVPTQSTPDSAPATSAMNPRRAQAQASPTIPPATTQRRPTREPVDGWIAEGWVAEGRVAGG